MDNDFWIVFLVIAFFLVILYFDSMDFFSLQSLILSFVGVSFVISLISSKDSKWESRAEFVESQIVMTIVIAVILLIIYFVLGFTFITVSHSVDETLNWDEISELDKPGNHNNTIKVLGFKEAGHQLFYPYDGEIRYLDMCYYIIGDDGRDYYITGGCYDGLNNEYNNSVEGHKLNIFYFNDGNVGFNRHRQIPYETTYISTDTGNIILDNYT